MDTAARNVKVGITTDELDRIVHEVDYNIECFIVIVGIKHLSLAL